MKTTPSTKSAAGLLRRRKAGATGVAIAANATANGARLRPGEIDLWRIALDAVADAEVQRLRATLSPEEEERVRGFYFERDRRRFVVCRGALRSLLAAYLGCSAESIVFAYGVNGKPRLADEFQLAVPLAFNVAHSEDLALCAIACGGEVGVDLERIRDLPDWESIASMYFARADYARVQAAAPALRRNEFFRAWTRQEALLKASGVGLGGMDERGSQWRGGGAAGDAPPAALHADAATAFEVYSFLATAAHIAALAVTREAERVASFTWSAPTSGAAINFPRRVQRRGLNQLQDAGPDLL